VRGIARVSSLLAPEAVLVMGTPVQALLVKRRTVLPLTTPLIEIVGRAFTPGVEMGLAKVRLEGFVGNAPTL
jgi:hypothetical protein